ncbi:hypothetical protein EDB81DRAFT_782448 [Dactylonectria macrodidyma]|uniref:Zn(2)-C6 fungal-type domain-containing protein n=1 Tax=Dactylonectria macrodidyma TaxID=307937 RepID=A0A9P9FM11_9HYPO|nr:hypothetical protein EDB81DRAFT_782448 [Dactylonectria macrodidyma]
MLYAPGMAASNASRGSRKRPTPSDADSSGDLVPNTAAQQLAAASGRPLVSASSSRTGLACEACRLRKTRCVGFPTCTWCQQRRHPCVRGQNSQTSPLDEWGNHILDALSLAKTEILSASGGACKPHGQSPNDAPEARRGISADPDRHSGLSIPQWTASPRTRGQDGFRGISGADTILEWDVLKAQLSNLPGELLHAKDGYEPDRCIQSKGSADTSTHGLQRLRQRFERKFLTRYPIISRPRLARYIRDVAENGGDWTAEACLVFLVCAIASLCDCLATDSTTPTAQSVIHSPFSASTPGTPAPVSRQSAYQYWTMAKRRLGWALDTPAGLLTAQSLCLAGFWHLQNCAPTKARNMFRRAAESASDRGLGLNIMDEEKGVASFTHLLCTDLFQRLDIELGLSPLGGLGVADSEMPLDYSRAALLATGPPSDHFLVMDPVPDMIANLQQIHAIRKDVNKILVSTPSISNWHELYSLLGQVAECRSRLHDLTEANTAAGILTQHLKPGQTPAAAVTQDIRQRELAALVLRPCLHLYLSPRLLQNFKFSTSPALDSHNYILNEVAALASECISLMVEVLQSHLDTWQHEDSWTDQPSPPHLAAPSEPSCLHLEAELSHRFSYAGCLVLLAVHYAEARALRGEIEYAHCHTLTLPVGWRNLVKGHATVFLSLEEGSSIWRCGQVLRHFDMGL